MDGQDRGTIVIEDEILREGFTQVPNRILRDPGVSVGAKLAYAVLLSYAWEKDSCFPGQEQMAADMGVGQTALKTYLRELVDSRLISAKRRGLGLTNLYTILSRRSDSDSLESRMVRSPESDDPESRNPAENNTHVEQDTKTTTRTTTGNPQPRLSALRVEDLNTLIHAYPKHRVVAKDKEAIAAIWNDRVAVNEVPPMSYILERLEKQKSSDDWTKDSGRWVPKIQNYIGNRGWDTVVVYDKPTANLSYSERQASLAAGGQGRVVV